MSMINYGRCWSEAEIPYTEVSGEDGRGFRKKFQQGFTYDFNLGK